MSRTIAVDSARKEIFISSPALTPGITDSRTVPVRITLISGPSAVLQTFTGMFTRRAARRAER